MKTNAEVFRYAVVLLILAVVLLLAGTLYTWGVIGPGLSYAERGEFLRGKLLGVGAGFLAGTGQVILRAWWIERGGAG